MQIDLLDGHLLTAGGTQQKVARILPMRVSHERLWQGYHQRPDVSQRHQLSAVLERERRVKFVLPRHDEVNAGIGPEVKAPEATRLA